MPTPEELAAEKAEAAKKAADEADKALEARIAKTVNAAITGHIKRIPAGLTPEDLEKWADEREKKRTELQAEEDRKKKEGGKGGENAPEIAKLTKQIEELRKKAETAEAKSAAQEKKQQEADDKGTITKTLEAAGVPAGARARMALNHLLSEGLVKRTDDGIVFVGKDGEEDLADGITAFLKTEDGKLFLPPSGAGGSGSGARRGTSNGSEKKNSKARLAEVIARNKGLGE